MAASGVLPTSGLNVSSRSSASPTAESTGDGYATSHRAVLSRCGVSPNELHRQYRRPGQVGVDEYSLDDAESRRRLMRRYPRAVLSGGNSQGDDRAERGERVYHESPAKRAGGEAEGGEH